MDGWSRTLGVVAIAPAVVVSTVLWLVGVVLLPAVVGGLLLFAPLVLALAWVPRSGRSGRLVDRIVDGAGTVLAGAREPTAAELAALQPVLARLLELDVEPMRLLVSRSARPYPPVRPFGCDQVVLSPVLAEAVCRRQLEVEDAVALIVYTIGWLGTQPRRGAVAVAAWTLPWRVVAAATVRLGRAARWVPFVGFAWRLRFVVGTVAVVQSAVEGRVASAALVALFVVATYATPAAERARGARLMAVADHYVTARGLGPTLLGAMYRVGAPTPDIERTARLRGGGARVDADGAGTTASARRLHLVPS